MRYLNMLINLAWLAALAVAAWFGSVAWVLAIVGAILLELTLEVKLLRQQQSGQPSSRHDVSVAAQGGGATGGASLHGALWGRPQ